MDSMNGKYLIVKKTMPGAEKGRLLRLNREKKSLEMFVSADREVILANYPIEENFDFSNYATFEKVRNIPCIFGRKDSMTPSGIFNIEFKSKDCYIRGYEELKETKFFGYMGFFEDFLIHSNIFLMEVNEEEMRAGKAKSISLNDVETGGCIRIGQSDLDYLLENIEIGTILIL